MNNDKVREAMLLHLDVVERFIKNSSACDISNEMDNIRNLKYLINKNPWQPIETAPKDGTLVLLCMTDGDMTTASYKVYKNLDEYNWRNWGLVVSGGHAEDNELNDEPTHWQPLPNPPEKK